MESETVAVPSIDHWKSLLCFNQTVKPPPKSNLFLLLVEHVGDLVMQVWGQYVNEEKLVSSIERFWGLLTWIT